MAYSTLAIQPSIGAGVRICRPDQGQTAVTMDSPALTVMTDLRRVAAAVISPQETMDAAHAHMFQRGVRMLLVVDAQQALAGIITATDILGEKPVGVAYEKRIRHDEILVADLMTPSDRLESFDLHTVEAGRVGQVVASLQQARRHHALVLQGDGAGGREVRGIFSLSQIARQLGMPLALPEQAGSFAEIEAALA